MTIDLGANISIMLTIISVGIALAGLIWKLHRDTQQQISELDSRMRSLERQVAELKGFIQGLLDNRMRTSV